MANTDGKVPIGDSIRAGFTFMRSSLRVVLPAALVVAGVNTVSVTLLTPDLASAAAFPVRLIALGASVMFSAFLLRLALFQDASGMFGLKLGAEEGRLLGVGAALFVLYFVIVCGALIVALFVAAMFAAQGRDPAELQAMQEQMQNNPAAAEAFMAEVMKGPGGTALFVVLGLALALLIWVSTRLSLAMPATIGERRMMAFSTYSWTKGNTLGVFAATVGLAAPLLLAIVAAGAVVGALAGDADAAFTPKAGKTAIYAGAQFVVLVGEHLFLLPALAGLSAFLYKGLRPPGLPKV